VVEGTLTVAVSVPTAGAAPAPAGTVLDGAVLDGLASLAASRCTTTAPCPAAGDS
jgi:hypothetical protein